MRGRISRKTIDELRARVNIAEVVSDVVELKRAGASLKGLCPFHREKTPSFFVSPEKGVYHCFGCGEGGDTITFLMKFRQLTYGEAVLELCERFGIEVEFERGEGVPTEVGGIFRMHEVAADYYHLLLRDRPNPAWNYLKERGVKEETISELRLGYGGKDNRGLLKHLKMKGFSPEEIEKAGLAYRSRDGNLVDRFRGRLIFPIRSPRGKVVGFAGRILGAGEPKYMNSPETPIYRKKRVLFGMDLAGRHIREEGFAVLVEGYMDWIALWENGIRNVVATCGTALTEDHLRALKRSAGRVVLLFDGDLAGKKAAVRSFEPAVRAGVKPLVVFPPGRKDPDDWIREVGADVVSAALKSPVLLMEYIIDAAAKKFDVSKRSGKIDYLDFLEKYVSQINDPAEKRLYCEMIADKVGLPVETVESRYASGRKAGALDELDGGRGGNGLSPEDVLLGFLLNHPEVLSDEKVREAVEGLDPAYREVLISRGSVDETSGGVEASISMEEKEKIISRAILLYERHFPIDSADNIGKILSYLSLKRKEDEVRRLKDRLARGDFEDKKDIIRRITALTREMEELRKIL